MMLLVFGLMAIGSVFVIGGWARQGWRNREPLSIYNAPLMLAIGLDTGSIGMAIQTGVRVIDIVRGADFPTHTPFVYFTGTWLIIFSKVVLVWVISLKQGREYSIVLWWSYVISMFAWTWFCLLWSI